MKKRIQPHIMCGHGDIAKYVLVPGDPGRVERIATFFDEKRKVADYRGFISYTGRYNGVDISVCSTGIGCPSAAIVIEELSRIGADTFIRVGTTGALQENVKMGDIVIASAAVRGDGTSRTYVSSEFPAVANFEVTKALLEASKKLKCKTHFGIVFSSDAFYGDLERLDYWKKRNVISVEMECSVLFTLVQLKKLRAGAILVSDGNPLLGLGKGEFDHGEKTGELDQRVQKAIDEEIRIAIEAVKILDKQDRNDFQSMP